ncbi:MAG: hypothetical protein IJU27_04000 [Bacteroidales bacterium]|nr:hypothetical protein [Bacteroidales bacterium]
MMKLHILTPESSRSIEAEAVFFPGTRSAFEVLPSHAPIISTLEAGKLRWRAAGKEESIDIRGGVMQLENDEIKVCAQL